MSALTGQERMNPVNTSEENSTSLTASQVRALKLIQSGEQMRLTDHANALVSRQAKALRQMSFIQEAPERWIAYRLTASGEAVLTDAARCEAAENALRLEVGCLSPAGSERHDTFWKAGRP